MSDMLNINVLIIL